MAVRGTARARVNKLVEQDWTATGARRGRIFGDLPAVVLRPLVDPLLHRTVTRLAQKHRSIFARLGPHIHTDFIIDPLDLPFALHLKPDPDRPLLKAVSRGALPRHDALIRGRFRTLFDLIDAGEDGDAAFFSRDLLIEGDTDAVVTLRNALDDVDGSIAADTAALFGPPGRLALSVLRRGAAAPVKGYPS